MDLKKIQLPANAACNEPIEFGDGRTTGDIADLRLDCTQSSILPSLVNMATVLDGLSIWSGVFVYDELAEQIMVTRAQPGKSGNPNFFKPRPYRDTDVNDVRMWFNRHLKWNKASKSDVFDAIQQAAHERVVSPVRHYLEALPSLSVEEASEYLETVLITHFGLKVWGEHPETLIYSKIVFRKWLISAVARALQPGCKADHVLILEGAQGAGKSTAIRKLCGDMYFGDTLPRLDTKDANDYVRGKWIIELAELSSVSKTEVEHVKAFITRTEEKFRPAFGRAEITYQRRCVFIGTTNRSDYLRDETGNRRFWPIKLEAVDVAAIERDRDLIWSAAKALFDAGEPWWLSDDEAELAYGQQQQRTAHDPLFEEIANWLQCHAIERTSIMEVYLSVLCKDQETPDPVMPHALAHRIRGALLDAGYASTGKKFTSGENKGRIIIERVHRQPA